MNNRLFCEKQAAEYLGISANTLRKQRSDGERENHIPLVPYIKLGSRTIRYAKEDLDQYIDNCKEGRS